MKIIQYSQHVLGVGHFFRSLEISRALRRHEVILVSGGPPIDVAPLQHMREVRLPQLEMDQEFRELRPSQPDHCLEEIKAQRRQQLFRLFEDESPDLFLVELYPFGRKAFRHELDPILQALGDESLRRCRVVCSVRDILVEKENQQKHEARTVDVLNRFFDLVMVHSDPTLFKIDETFSRIEEIAVPIVYTGYIAPAPQPNARRRIRRQMNLGPTDRLIIASAGGGNVGAKLLGAVIEAGKRIRISPRPYLHVFTGPFIHIDDYDRLQRMAADRTVVETFTTDFLSYLAAADLSVSMGGYNTTMNLLASAVPALVWPFAQNREQRMRATRLSERGHLTVLTDEDLAPERLAKRMAQMLIERRRTAPTVDLDGARKTAQWLDQWMGLSAGQ
jgi:predicted glycosyltransferase